MGRTFAACLAVVAALFFTRSLQGSMRGVFVRFGHSGSRLQCFRTQRRAMRFSHLAEMLETTSQFRGSGAMAQKKAELVKLFNSIDDVDDMKLALKLLFGKMKRSQVGTALLVAATDELGLKKTPKPKEKLLAWLSNGEVADVGEGWERLLQKEAREVDSGGNWTLEKVWKALAEIQQVESKGAVKQRAKLVGQLATGCGASVPAGSKYLCRILLGDGLAIGASKKTFAIAFAEQSLVPNGERLLELLEVNPEMDAVVDMLMGKTQLASGARLWCPIAPACAQAAKSVEEVMEKISKKKTKKWRAEWKYDGERLQVHADKAKKKVQLFSRNLKDATERYPQIRDALLNDENVFKQIILDAEVAAVDGERILPFQILARRPRKATPDVDSRDVADVCFFIFDCLYLDGKSLLHESLEERRAKMSAVLGKGKQQRLKLAEGESFATAKTLQKALEKSIAASTEGLVLKNLESPYEPGIRTTEWLKLKKDYLDSSLSDSVDGVVVGVRRGKGRRSGVYGSFLLAVRAGKKGKFQTLCAVGTGLSAQDLKDYYALCQSLVSDDNAAVPKYLETTPSMTQWLWISDISKAPVMEITGADLTTSTIHSCAMGSLEDPNRGLGLRFPRVLRVRGDKEPKQATTADEIFAMYQSQPLVRSAPKGNKTGNKSTGKRGKVADEKYG